MITEISGDLLEPLVNVYYLSLLVNQLELFPDRQVHLPSLEYLFLGHNKLTSIQIIAPKLNYLNIAMNQFNGLEDIVEATSFRIQDLYVHYNHMSNLDPKTERLFTNLVTVNLRYNDLMRFPDFSGSADSLRTIDLDYNDIKYISSDLLAKFYNLEQLSLNNNRLKVFPDIWVLPKLDTINFRGNPLPSFPHITEDLPNLIHMDICSTQISYIPPFTAVQPGFELLVDSSVDLCHCHNSWMKLMPFYNMSLVHDVTTACNGQLWNESTIEHLFHHCEGLNPDVKRMPFVQLQASVSVKPFLPHSRLPGVSVVECGRHCGRTVGCVAFYFAFTTPGIHGHCVIVAPTAGEVTVSIPSGGQWYYYGVVY